MYILFGNKTSSSVVIQISKDILLLQCRFTEFTLACKQALRTGYSEICLRIEVGRETGEPAMVFVRFEYLRSDSERKLMIGQFDLTHVN